MNKNKAVLFIKEVNAVREMVDRKARPDIIYSTVFDKHCGSAAYCSALWKVEYWNAEYFATSDSNEDEVMGWLEAHEAEADALAHAFDIQRRHNKGSDIVS